MAGVQKPVEKISACEISKDSDCKRTKHVNMKNMSGKQRNDFGEEKKLQEKEELSHYEKVVFDAQTKLSSDISVDRYLKEQAVILSCFAVLDIIYNLITAKAKLAKYAVVLEPLRDRTILPGRRRRRRLRWRILSQGC